MRACIDVALQECPAVNDIVFTQANSTRAATHEDFAAVMDELEAEDGLQQQRLNLSWADTVDEATEAAMEKAAAAAPASADGAAPEHPPEHPPAYLLVCGSIYMMAEARAALGVVEPRDDLDLVHHGVEKVVPGENKSSSSSASSSTSTKT